MVFELGKSYRHNAGAEMKIVGLADTTVYGLGFVAETPKGTYDIVGMNKDHALNWKEISQEEWMKNFNK